MAKLLQILSELIDILVKNLPLVLVVIGWIVTHTLTLRSQRKTFENQVLDRARTDITDSIRNVQDWLGKIQTTILDCKVSVSLEGKGHVINWQEKQQRILDLIKNTETTQWIFRMEDNLVLFPECGGVLIELSKLQQGILQSLVDLHSALLVAGLAPIDFDRRKQVFFENQKTENLTNTSGEQAALLEDLRVHLQNKVLARISGKPIPTRVPRDPQAKRIEKEKDILVVRTTTEIQKN